MATNARPTIEDMTIACGIEGDHATCQKYRLKVLGKYACKCLCHVKPATGACEKCGKPNRTLTNTGTEAFPYMECGACIHRRERSHNTREMYGHGRRGY